MKEPFSFQWHITDECDQRCKHCYIFSEDNGKKIDAMTWAQMQDTLANCCNMCEMYGRQPYFYITGGDPILHPDFWRLQLRQLPLDHPAKRRPLRLPPGAEQQGGQCA